MKLEGYVTDKNNAPIANDEIYFVVEELRKDFPDLSFTQMSDCAGVLILD